MSIFKCPGSDSIRYPRPETVPCPHCGKEMEIWSDEEETACPDCGGAVFREMPAACWEWCAYARECIGPGKYVGKKPQEQEDNRC
jgi:hypothetical protein